LAYWEMYNSNNDLNYIAPELKMKSHRRIKANGLFNLIDYISPVNKQIDRW